MRKLIVVACSLALLAAGWCFGQAQHGSNGNSWHVLSPAAHTFYVKGFYNGYASASVQMGALTIAKNAPEKVSSMKPAERKDYEEALRWAKLIAPFMFNGPPRSVGEFEGALDTFYSDYRNTPVCLNEAILFSIASLAGNPATNQELTAARKAGAESGCK
jgi:hypothetical protein